MFKIPHILWNSTATGNPALHCTLVVIFPKPLGSVISTLRDCYAISLIGYRGAKILSRNTL